VSKEIIVAIQSYGDLRADRASNTADKIGEVILMIRDALATAGASNERADAELTPDRICQIAYMHSSDDDEPLFSFGHRELLEFVAAVRELSK
jgi:hypothetical protein